MFKLCYCWKCEEINKSRHNLLCLKLPDNLIEAHVKTFAEYHVCKECERRKAKNENEPEPSIVQIIRAILYRFYDIWTTDDAELLIIRRREYREMIKHSQHPLKKQMLKYISKTLSGGKDTVSLLNRLLRYDYQEEDFTNIEYIYTGEDKEIVKTILLVVFEFLQIYSDDKYNITEQAIHDYLEDRLR